MNALSQLVQSIGLGDGTGQVSSMRIMVMLVLLTVLVPKVVIAIQTSTTPEWSESDMAILGIAFGAKLWQNNQENAGTTPPTPPPK